MKKFKYVYKFFSNTLSGFNKNQGMLLSGAIAYYALLSFIPLILLSVIALSHFIDRAALLLTLGRYLEWLVPSQSNAFLADISDFLENGIAIGSFLLATIFFFSSLAFSVLQKAMAVIFSHRELHQKRHFIVSAILPYGLVLLLCASMLCVTVVSVTLQTMAQESIQILGVNLSLRGVSWMFIYLIGFISEAVILATLYLVLPIGRTKIRYAFIGGLVATVLWELSRHLLIWYFANISKASVVYGSLTTSVVTLFSMEIAAILFLFGAQVISEYEKLEDL